MPGVYKVDWHTTKTEQGNLGDRYSERNMLVYSSLARRCQPLEFEVTRWNHKKDRHAPFTVTVCFKEPPRDCVAEAWRILSHVCAGKELLPEHVAKYKAKCLRKYSEGDAPGSASAPRKKVRARSPSRGTEPIPAKEQTLSSSLEGGAGHRSARLCQRGESCLSPRCACEEGRVPQPESGNGGGSGKGTGTYLESGKGAGHRRLSAESGNGGNSGRGTGT